MFFKYCLYFSFILFILSLINEFHLVFNLSDLAVASSQYDILLYSETLVSICVTCQSCRFLGSVALSCCAGASCLVPVGWRHMYEKDMEHFDNQNLSMVAVKCWLLGFVV